MDNKIDLNGIFETARKKQEKKEKKEITFKEYLKLVEKNPKIANNSPARLEKIILSHGVEKIPERERIFIENGEEITKRFELFSKSLFGVEKPAFQFVRFIKAGARNLSTGKQVVLLVGPPASGKSTFVNIIKNALEAYEEPVFRIKGCPINEEPLHLVPRHMKKQVALKSEDCPDYPDCKGEHLHLGIKIEGDLCPTCKDVLKRYRDDNGVVRWWDVPVEQFSFSRQSGRGIGSFEPTEEKTQDIAQLVGRENISVTAAEGYESPDAFNLPAGELWKGNRGIFEGRELVKSAQELLWVFISVAEEKEVKVQGSPFPYLGIDTLVVGHTNLAEYRKFSGDESNEALHDRIYTIPFPYPLQIRKEERVYEKLIKEESMFDNIGHISPGALKLAATFAVMTRLRKDSKTDLDPLTRAKILNGDYIPEMEEDPVSVRDIITEGLEEYDVSKRDGMFGLSSRDILAALNEEIVQREGGCLTPLNALNSLVNVFEHRVGMLPEDVDYYRELLLEDGYESVYGEYKRFVIESVKKAYLRSHQDLTQQLFDKYLEEAGKAAKEESGYLSDLKPSQAKIGKGSEVDFKFLQSVERFMGIEEEMAQNFRSGILIRRGDFLSRGEKFGPDQYPVLKRAIEEKLLADNRASLSLVLDQDAVKGEEEKARAKDLFEGLSGEGFCRICAKEIVEEAAKFLNE